eukprot:TRINITY_DN3814_c0_g1_i2.p1 TRINITY_DN3814_c0_g1~~TRINITY_DN3814_c0_g1_i2.p1  ORF type:complete len:334 (+),score=56.71 TRINITY_DN3814_c0_g1_i2:50-1051(+)
MESKDLYALLILTMYAFALVHLCTQGFRLVKYKHQLTSFQALFIQLNFVWAIFRFVYFAIGLADHKWNRLWEQILVYWLPFVVQYSTFSLLIMFYASLVFRKTWWVTHRAYFLAVYIVTNILQYIFLAVWISLGVSEGQTKSLEQDISLYASVIYFALAAGLGIFGYLVHRHPLGYHEEVVYHASGYYWPALTLFLLLCFASRSIYSFYDAFDGNQSNFHEKAVKYDLDFPYFAVMLAWELIPVSIVLFFFKIPNCAKIYQRLFQTETRELPPTLILQINTVEIAESPFFETRPRKRSNPINVFENIRRYDTDTESTDPISLMSSAIEFTQSG